MKTLLKFRKTWFYCCELDSIPVLKIVFPDAITVKTNVIIQKYYRVKCVNIWEIRNSVT